MGSESPDLVDTWNSIIGNTADEQTRLRTLQRAAGDLDAALNLQADYASRILSAIEDIAGGSLIDADAWVKVDRTLGMALGNEPTNLIAWLVSNERYEERLAEVAPLLSPTAEAFIRSVLAQYARPLEAASYLSSTGMDDDWREIVHRISQDTPSGSYLVRFRIRKYNGETIVIETSADGVISMASVLLSALNTIGERRAFYRDFSGFVNEMEQFMSILQSPPDEASKMSELVETAPSNHAGSELDDVEILSPVKE